MPKTDSQIQDGGEETSNYEEVSSYLTFTEQVDDLTVSVYAAADAVPEGTVMEARPVEAQDVLDNVAETAESETVSVIDAVEIVFVDQSGQEVQPASAIYVEMTSENIQEAVQDSDTVAVVQMDSEKSGDTAELKSTFDAEQVSFVAEKPAVYAVVAYTVDFHYEVNGRMYDFSISGGSFTALEHVVEVLGIAFTGENAESSDEDIDAAQAAKKFVSQVANVSFSDDMLVWVGKVEENTTVGAIKDGLGLVCEYSAALTEEEIEEINSSVVEAGDWAIISLKPFTSDEALTVRMVNGDEWTVRVTDVLGNMTININATQMGKVYSTVSGGAFNTEVSSGSKTTNHAFLVHSGFCKNRKKTVRYI